jgi:hypothetical protein
MKKSTVLSPFWYVHLIPVVLAAIAVYTLFYDFYTDLIVDCAVLVSASLSLGLRRRITSPEWLMYVDTALIGLSALKIVASIWLVGAIGA